jgi:hypothetical protein
MHFIRTPHAGFLIGHGPKVFGIVLNQGELRVDEAARDVELLEPKR